MFSCPYVSDILGHERGLRQALPRSHVRYLVVTYYLHYSAGVGVARAGLAVQSPAVWYPPPPPHPELPKIPSTAALWAGERGRPTWSDLSGDGHVAASVHRRMSGFDTRRPPPPPSPIPGTAGGYHHTRMMSV